MISKNDFGVQGNIVQRRPLVENGARWINRFTIETFLDWMRLEPGCSALQLDRSAFSYDKAGEEVDHIKIDGDEKLSYIAILLGGERIPFKLCNPELKKVA